MLVGATVEGARFAASIAGQNELLLDLKAFDTLSVRSDTSRRFPRR